MERSGEGSFLVDAMGGVNELSISGLNFTDLNGMSGMATSVPLIGSTVGAFGSGSTVVIDSCDFRNFVNGTLFLESFISDGVTDPSVLDVRSSVFDSGSARETFLAGAITVDRGMNSDLRFVDSTLRNNTSLGNGGAIRIEEAESVLIDSCVIEMNEALNNGDGGGVSLSNVTQAVEVRDSLFSGNFADGRAGAFALGLCLCVSPGLSSVSLLGTDFLDNLSGGGNGGAVTLLGNNGTLVVGDSPSRSTRFLRNSAALGGGAILLRDFSNVDFRNADFRNNTATFRGGAINVSGVSGDTNITDCNFQENIGNVAQNIGSGGGVFGTLLGTFNVIDSVFRQNEVPASLLGGTQLGGGAIAVRFAGSTSLSGSSFISNQNDADNGGAVAFSNITAITSSVVVDRCDFEGNSAAVAGDGNGGALSIASATEVEIMESTFSRNFAFIRGGAVFVDFAGFGLDPNPAVTITLCNFTDNNARGAGGGGVALRQANNDVGFFGCRFVNNEAGRPNLVGDRLGGAILIEDSPFCGLSINNADTGESNFFFNNTAIQGGAIALNDLDSVQIVGANFTANTVPVVANDPGTLGFGGAIGAFLAGDFSVQDSAFIRNEAFSGPAIFADDSSGPPFVGLDPSANNVFQGNVAGDSGSDVTLFGYVI